MLLPAPEPELDLGSFEVPESVDTGLGGLSGSIIPRATKGKTIDLDAV